MRVCDAKRAGKLSAEEEAELAARGEKDSELAAMSRNECAMRGVRELGRRPKESVKSPPKERRLATRLRNDKRRGKQSEEQKAELAAMKKQEQEEQAEKKRMDSFMEEIRKFGRQGVELLRRRSRDWLWDSRTPNEEAS